MEPLIKDEQYKEENIHGVIYNMSPSPHHRHSEIISNINYILRRYLKSSMCRIYADSIDVYFEKGSKDYVIPDLSLICDTSKFKGGSYYGVPKLIVEVLSPSTRLKDLTIKKALYEEKGVGEYWIVDYGSQSIDIYHLIEGKYQLRHAHTLVDDQELSEYNVGTQISLKEFPNIKVLLEEIFE